MAVVTWIIWDGSMCKRISIIVPIYNNEAYLEKCLNSLQAQTHTELEILLIDDGSVDASAEICKRFAEADDRFRYFYQQNAGVSAARNKGLDVATGDYVGFCDSDDWVEPDMYAVLYDLAKAYQAEVAITSFIREVAGKEEPWKDDLTVRTFTPEQAIQEMLKGELFGGYLCNKLFKRELFDNLRLDTQIAIYEDTLACWEATRRSQKVVFRDVHKYHYMINAQSAMASGYKEKHWSARTAAYKLYENMKQYYPQNVIYAQRTIVVNSYWLAEKMALSRCLSKEKYQILKNDFKTHYSKEVAALIDKKFRRKYAAIAKGRVFFTLFIKALLVFRKLKQCLR